MIEVSEGINFALDVVSEAYEVEVNEVAITVNEVTDTTVIEIEEGVTLTCEVGSNDVEISEDNEVAVIVVETSNEIITEITEGVNVTIEVNELGAGGGDGDMKKLIYDPGGREADTFDAGNLYGNLDGGTFN
jgi:hypothetical protein